MKCSLKDGFISILLIILFAPSKGTEFPLLLQTNSVLDKPMNFQKFKAAINRLQDLDSFPDNGNPEGNLHKIVKKQMAVSDGKELKKTKRSTLSVFNLPTNYNRAPRKGDEIWSKETKKKYNMAQEIDRLSEGNLRQDSKISDEILVTLKDIVKDKPNLSSNRTEKKIPIQKGEEKKLKGKTHVHPSHASNGLKECKVEIRPKSEVKEKLNSASPTLKPSPVNNRIKEKPSLVKPASKTKQHSANAGVKEKQSLSKTIIKAPSNAVHTLEKVKEAQHIPTIGIKAKNVPNTGIKQAKLLPHTGIKEAKTISHIGIPHIGIKEVKNIINNEIKESQNTPHSALEEVHNIPKIKATKMQNNPNTAIKSTQNVPQSGRTEVHNAVHTAIAQKKSFPNNGMSEKHYSPSAKSNTLANTAKTTGVQMSQMNPYLGKKYRRIPGDQVYRSYYEHEEKPCRCMMPRYKRCPEGQFFSYKCLKCLKVPTFKSTRATLTNFEAPDMEVFKEPAHEVLKKSAVRSLKTAVLKRIGRKAKRTSNPPNSKKNDIFDNPEDPEPSNEWMDANQGQIQKIPPEFKPKKTPGLKIYHLCSKRKMKVLLQKVNVDQILQDSLRERKTIKRDMTDVIKGAVKRHSSRQHHPRSFVIHIKKKEGKENNDQGITENDESEEDEENDEDDDDEDSEDEDDEAEDEVQENVEEKSSRKDTLKEFFKSAKAAVTNRARFNDPSLTEPEVNQKGSNIKSKSSDLNSNFKDKNKKVLLDANIKVDSTIGSALKYILKSKTKDKENHSSASVDERLISDRGSQDQLDPELIRMYEYLIRNNPRVKRYFLAICSKKGN